MASNSPILGKSNFEELRTKTFTFRLFGLHIGHSKSPLLQNYLFKKLGLNWRYELYESSDIDAFKKVLQGEDCIGSAVTMPNKVVMAEHVDFVDSDAKAVGAINTIYTRKEKNTGKTLYIGTNTDTYGIRDSFLYNAPEVVKKSKGSNKPGLVYGGGGACRSAVYALNEFLGCSKVYVINRFAEEVEAVREGMVKGGFKGEIIHVSTPEQAATLEKPSLIVCTVPDFAPLTEEEKTARATLEVFIGSQERGAVLEMCYHPKPLTRLYNEFKASNWQVIGGMEAMIYQGFAQQSLWTGYSLNEMPVKDVIEYVYKNANN